MEKFLFLLKSRKFWAAMVALVLIVVKAYDPDFPLEEEMMTNVIWIVVAYIVGTGIEDSGALRFPVVEDEDPPPDEFDHAGMY